MNEQHKNCDQVGEVNKGIRNNENWAFKCLYQQCFPKIATWKPLAHKQELTQDLFQDALLKYRGTLLNGKEVETPCAYLFTIVKNDFFKHQKQEQNMETYDDTYPEGLAFEGPEGFSPDDWGIAYDCILALGKADQKLLFMTFFNKFPDDIIAETLGYRNLNALRAARSRAMGNLRNCLKTK